MRIAVVHSYYSGSQPSGENAVVDAQVEALRAAGHDVALFARRTDEVRLEERGYNVRSAARVGFGTGKNPLVGIRSFAPDVVHVHNLFPNIGSRWLARLSGCAVVSTVHNHRFECAAATLFRDGHSCAECLRVPVVPAVLHGCYRNRLASIPPALASAPRIGTAAALLNRADAVVCLNGLVLDHLARRVSDPEKVVVVPNFPSVPVDLIEPTDVVPVDALFVGRIGAQKGVSRAVSAWPSSRHLTVVGDGPELNELRRAAEQRQDVRVLGQLAPSRVRQLMNQARVLVVPSLSVEGFPTVVLEALQAGLPVVLSETVAIAPLLTQEGAAESFSFDDPVNGLDAALARLAEREEDARRRARQLFERDYSRSAWLDRMGEVYRTASARAARRK